MGIEEYVECVDEELVLAPNGIGIDALLAIWPPPKTCSGERYAYTCVVVKLSTSMASVPDADRESR